MDQPPPPHTFTLHDLVIIEQERKDSHSSPNRPDLPTYRIISKDGPYKHFVLQNMVTGERHKHCCKPHGQTSSSPLPKTNARDDTKIVYNSHPLLIQHVHSKKHGRIDLVIREEDRREFFAAERSGIPVYSMVGGEGAGEVFELEDVRTGIVREGWCEAWELRLVEGVGGGEEGGEEGLGGKDDG